MSTQGVDDGLPAERVQREPYTPRAWKELEPEWEVLAKAASVSHFISSDWVATWLEVYGRGLGSELWTYRSGGALRGACLLTSRRERRGPVPVDTLYLNTAGAESGGIRVEYNQLLSDPNRDEGAARAFAEAVIASAADELIVEGLTAEEFEHLKSFLPSWKEDVMWSEDPFVNLERLRGEGAEYRRSALSKNSRGQVNRTLNAYAKLGEVRTEIANTTLRAVEMLHELSSHHQATWLERSGPGAFASDQFRVFHQALIERAFGRGAIQMLRVTAAEELIGVLYNFLDRGRVFFYQSGLKYRDDNRFRPGLAAHVVAIERCMELGLAEYHFLAGDELTPRYKRSLSTDVQKLAWATLRRPGLKTWTIDRLRSLKVRFREWDGEGSENKDDR